MPSYDRLDTDVVLHYGDIEGLIDKLLSSDNPDQYDINTLRWLSQYSTPHMLTEALRELWCSGPNELRMLLPCIEYVDAIIEPVIAIRVHLSGNSVSHLCHMAPLSEELYDKLLSVSHIKPSSVWAQLLQYTPQLSVGSYGTLMSPYLFSNLRQWQLRHGTPVHEAIVGDYYIVGTNGMYDYIVIDMHGSLYYWNDSADDIVEIKSDIAAKFVEYFVTRASFMTDNDAMQLYT
jgi:hypothetical protein